MRLGLIGQVRRVLAPRGVKIIQPLQREYKYKYLLLAVLPKEGILKWSWMPRMKQEHLKPLLESWNIDITIWDGAGVHRGHSLAELPGQRIIQPAYSPNSTLLSGSFKKFVGLLKVSFILLCSINVLPWTIF